MRIYDPTGTATDLIADRYPHAVVEQQRDGREYDAAVIYSGLDGHDRWPHPEMLVAEAAQAVRQGGRVFVRCPDGKPQDTHPSRVRALRSIDVAHLLQKHGRLTEFAITDDGHTVGAMTPLRRRGEVAVWTGYAIGPWHPTDITERGLGGSETAAWRLSEELAAMGWTVTLYGQFEEQGMVGDVMLRDFRVYDPTQPLDAFVGFRDATRFDHPINAPVAVLWLEDLPGAEGLTPERMENIDRVCTVTHWHKQAMLDYYPWLHEDQVVACRNGITHPYFQDSNGHGPPRREKRVLFTSSPDRGLDILLELWPRVRAKVPDAVLLSTYSRWYDLVAEMFPATAAHRRRVTELLDQPGVKRITGGMGQHRLAHLMRSSTVWAHPSWFTAGDREFHETSCISAMEAQAAGLVVVASNWGALTETVQWGTLVDGDPREKYGAWRDQFVDAIVQGLTDETTQQAAQEAGPEAVRDMDWRGATEQLAAILTAKVAA